MPRSPHGVKHTDDTWCRQWVSKWPFDT